mmetsp:Transcript_456/g.1094  ORF Transcript_456/g.1094 Transcript_456/m.1094 type:complete len:94 (-) Transcript_456:70-351(-)
MLFCSFGHLVDHIEKIQGAFFLYAFGRVTIGTKINPMCLHMNPEFLWKLPASVFIEVPSFLPAVLSFIHHLLYTLGPPHIYFRLALFLGGYCY